MSQEGGSQGASRRAFVGYHEHDRAWCGQRWLDAAAPGDAAQPLEPAAVAAPADCAQPEVADAVVWKDAVGRAGACVLC